MSTTGGFESPSGPFVSTPIGSAAFSVDVSAGAAADASGALAVEGLSSETGLEAGVVCSSLMASRCNVPRGSGACAAHFVFQAY